MSPSKRAGDTVEPDVDRPDTGATGAHAPDEPDAANGSADGVVVGTGDRTTRRPASARPKRRSTVAPAVTPPPERGSSSQRGASSSSITRRSVTGTAPTVIPLPEETPAATTEPEPGGPVDAVVEVEPTPLPAPALPIAEEAPATSEEPVVVPPIARPPVPPSARVDPAPRRGTDLSVVVPPWPIVTPAGPAVQRDASSVPATAEAEATAPPEPPYATTMSSHQVAPVPRIVGRRPRVRKVTRVVRHVDPWSVFKVALVFNLVLYGVLLTAGVLLWNVAYATGTIDNLERFFESFGWSEFEFDGGAIYHSGWIAGLFGVVGLTGAAVLAATLFNLITDLVGGVRMTVLEEEVVERTSAPMRRFTVRRPIAGGFDPGSEMRAEGSDLPARREPVEDRFL